MDPTVPQRMAGRSHVVGFVGGVLAVAVFHQSAVYLIGLAGIGEASVYSFRPTYPLGVPRVMSQMFWGGLWGILFAALVDRRPSHWPIATLGILFGVFVPTLFGIFVVTPMRGQTIVSVLTFRRLGPAMLINGSFGLGLALIFERLRRLVSGPAASRAPPRS
jgi:hypothetical protein